VVRAPERMQAPGFSAILRFNSAVGTRNAMSAMYWALTYVPSSFRLLLSLYSPGSSCKHTHKGVIVERAFPLRVTHVSASDVDDRLVVAHHRQMLRLRIEHSLGHIR
jgi:hypothetical protein